MDQRQGPLSVESKRALRTSLSSLREQFSPAVRAAFSRRITHTLLALPEYRRARVVMAYMSMGAEFETEAFVQRVLADGKRLVLPRVNRGERRLDLFAVSDLEAELAPGVWGILEPLPERCATVAATAVDFVLVPGLGFDGDGGRLGYGGGFYDRLLVAMTTATRVAAAFSAQVVDAVPMTAHDQRVELVVTEDGLLRSRR
ncbi:MAG: 5-formyltetrahydrofolate cyclo-ligase [Betaproteobacteria bacterium]|nr:5-formyltetrahydrofolate cyclo-ligase [Betaproteobacteria bacterium]